MYSVAILDDEKTVLEQLKSMITAYESVRKIRLKTTAFSDFENLSSFDLSKFDLFILDINLSGINGLQVAKKIREKNRDCVIIFCTNYAQYALNGYEVSALGYIIKPITEYSLFKNLDRAMNYLNSKNEKKDSKEKIVIKTLDEQKVIGIEKIVYAEIQRHDLYFYCWENETLVQIKTRGTMREITEQLCQGCFVRCHSSYLINMEHIVYILKSKSQVCLTGGVILTISRRYKKEFLEKVMEYL